MDYKFLNNCVVRGSLFGYDFRVFIIKIDPNTDLLDFLL